MQSVCSQRGHFQHKVEIQKYILKDLARFNGEEYCLATTLRKNLSINLSVKWSELLNVKLPH